MSAESVVNFSMSRNHSHSSKLAQFPSRTRARSARATSRTCLGFSSDHALVVALMMNQSRVALWRAASSTPSREDARAETREEHEDADDDDTDEHGRVPVETCHSTCVRRRPAKRARVLAKMFRLVSYGVDAFASGERGVCEEEECERERHCDGTKSHAPMASSRDLCASSALAWVRTISASASRGVMEWSGVRVLYTWKLQVLPMKRHARARASSSSTF